MDHDTIQKRRDSIIERYGAWTAHDIKLDEGLHTRLHEVPSEPKIWLYAEIISELYHVSFEGVRILDPGCLEGGYSPTKSGVC